MKKSNTPVLDQRIEQLIAEKSAALNIKKHLRPNVKILNDKINRLKKWRAEIGPVAELKNFAYFLRDKEPFIQALGRMNRQVPEFAKGGIFSELENPIGKSVVITGDHARSFFETLKLHKGNVQKTPIISTSAESSAKRKNYLDLLRDHTFMSPQPNVDLTECEKINNLCEVAGKAAFDNMVKQLAKVDPEKYIKSDSIVCINREDKMYMDAYLKSINRRLFINILGVHWMEREAVVVLKNYQIDSFVREGYLPNENQK